MFYKQHLTALDSFLNEVEYKIDRIEHDALAIMGGDFANCILSAEYCYKARMDMNAEGRLEEADMLIDEFVSFAEELDKTSVL